ncbi:MAG: hypothetical protein K0R14_353 [Burkholderiales bacterium]|jgi:hypothetical protein|nr:hypothetical protein [Burkholderiales bacterium]
MKNLIKSKTCKLTSYLAIILGLLYVGNAQSDTLQTGECFYQSDSPKSRFVADKTLILSWEADNLGNVYWKPNLTVATADYIKVKSHEFSEYSQYIFKKNGNQFLSGSEIKLVNMVFKGSIMLRKSPVYSDPEKENTLQLRSFQISENNQLWELNPMKESRMSQAEMVCKVTNSGTPNNSSFTTLNQIGTCTHQNSSKDSKLFVGDVISWRVFKDGSIWWKAGNNLEYNTGSWSQIAPDSNPEYALGGSGLKTMKFKGYLPIEKGDLGHPKPDEPHTWTVKVDTTTNKTAQLSRVKYMKTYEYALDCAIVNNPVFTIAPVKPDEKEQHANNNTQEENK